MSAISAKALGIMSQLGKESKGKRQIEMPFYIFWLYIIKKWESCWLIYRLIAGNTPGSKCWEQRSVIVKNRPRIKGLSTLSNTRLKLIQHLIEILNVASRKNSLNRNILLYLWLLRKKGNMFKWDNFKRTTSVQF